MAQTPLFHNSGVPLVDSKGMATPEFRQLMFDLVKLSPIVSMGSPEGMVLADQYSVYIDETDPDNPVTYRKMRTDVGGDSSKGWVVI